MLVPEVKLWQNIESIARNLFELYGYNEIRTPIIEPLELFRRSIGENTDIVEKEIFQFQDKSLRQISLRPEATASIARAYIENNLSQRPGLVKLYYIGPMFRAERPQRGRKRQFHQIGVEAIGSFLPEVDAEVIYLLSKFLNDLDIKDFHIQISTLGCREDKEKMPRFLKEAIGKNIDKYCPECQERFKKNILRILDCKNEICKTCLKKQNIDIKNVVCKDCSDHYEAVKKILASLGIKYIENKYLVRGLDYYTRTVFEFVHQKLGAQNAVAAGGRYDNLIKDMGGQNQGAAGFALGLERVLLLINEKKDIINALDVFLVLQDRKFLEDAFKTILLLRDKGITAEMDYQNRSFKSQMRLANEKGAGLALILGQDEWERGEFSLKDMKTGEQSRVKKEDIIHSIKR